MYEKLDKLRSDLERAKQRRAEAEAKVKSLEEKLKEAENSQVLADVNALKLTPEQVAQFLQLAASGQFPLNTGGNGVFGKEEDAKKDASNSTSNGQNARNGSEGLEKPDFDEDEENEEDREDYDYEK